MKQNSLTLILTGLIAGTVSALALADNSTSNHQAEAQRRSSTRTEDLDNSPVPRAQDAASTFYKNVIENLGCSDFREQFWAEGKILARAFADSTEKSPMSQAQAYALIDASLAKSEISPRSARGRVLRKHIAELSEYFTHKIAQDMHKPGMSIDLAVDAARTGDRTILRNTRNILFRKGTARVFDKRLSLIEQNVRGSDCRVVQLGDNKGGGSAPLANAGDGADAGSALSPGGSDATPTSAATDAHTGGGGGGNSGGGGGGASPAAGSRADGRQDSEAAPSAAEATVAKVLADGGDPALVAEVKKYNQDIEAFAASVPETDVKVDTLNESRGDVLTPMGFDPRVKGNEWTANEAALTKDLHELGQKKLELEKQLTNPGLEATAKAEMTKQLSAVNELTALGHYIKARKVKQAELEKRQKELEQASTDRFKPIYKEHAEVGAKLARLNQLEKQKDPSAPGSSGLLTRYNDFLAKRDALFFENREHAKILGGSDAELLESLQNAEATLAKLDAEIAAAPAAEKAAKQKRKKAFESLLANNERGLALHNQLKAISEALAPLERGLGVK